MHSFVHPFQATVDPLWEARSDWDIFRTLAQAVSKVATEAKLPIYKGSQSPFITTSPRKKHQTVARPRSLITQRRMEIKWGSNWDDDLASGDNSRADVNLKKSGRRLLLSLAIFL